MASCCVPTCTGSSMLIISTFARILVTFLFISHMNLSMIWRIPKFLRIYVFGLLKRSGKEPTCDRHGKPRKLRPGANAGPSIAPRRTTSHRRKSR